MNPRLPAPFYFHQLVTLSLLFLVTSLCRADDWSQFMGPNRDNKCLETGLNLDWPEEGLPIKWQRPCGEGYSAPSIREGKLIHLDRKNNEVVVACLDPQTGKSIWEYTYPTNYRDQYGYNGGPRSSPTIDENHVYVFGAQSVLTSLHLTDGSVAWQRDLAKDMDLPKNFFGNGLPAVLEGDTLLLNLGGTDAGFIIGVDKKTGKTRWQTKTQGASYSAAVVAPFFGTRIAVFLTREGLRMIDPETGKQIGELYPFRSRISDSVNGASPVIIGNRIFISAAYRTGAAMVEFDGKKLTNVWRNSTAMLTHWNTCIYHEGFLYGSSGRHSSNSTLRCIDATTGKLMWDNENPRELARATLLMLEGHFVILSEKGNLALVEATPKAYKLKKNVPTPLEYPAWAPPVIANGLLYLRSEKLLLCYDLRKSE